MIRDAKEANQKREGIGVEGQCAPRLVADPVLIRRPQGGPLVSREGWPTRATQVELPFQVSLTHKRKRVHTRTYTHNLLDKSHHFQNLLHAAFPHAHNVRLLLC